MRLCLSFICFLSISQLLFSQTDSASIVLQNPSFEDQSGCCKTPYGWTNCGLLSESPTDIHSGMNYNGKPLFGVKSKPLDGKTYIGMVVRKNKTNEKISQKLSIPLEQGLCYTFSINLAKSIDYNNGFESKSDSFELFDGSTVLRIWGVDSYCNQKEKLAESSVIENTDWKKYEFELNPKSNISYLSLEVYYDTTSKFPYNGNLLLDKASNLTKINCNKKSEYHIGQTIKIDRLYFKADSAAIKPESFMALDSLFSFLQINKKLIIEIGGHTNSIPSVEFCNKLSEKRANAIAEYLIAKGIEDYRITYKGYGKFFPIVSNGTKEGRLLNQRVEVKILKVE